jgi:hypothetical protein
MLRKTKTEQVETLNGKIIKQNWTIKRFFLGIKIHESSYNYSDEAKDLKKYL